jgi:hypothetical protein
VGYAKRSGDLDQPLSRIASFESFYSLVSGQLRFPAQPYAPSLGAFPSLASPRSDQFPLELRQSCQYGEHEASMGRRRVGPRIPQGAEASPPLRYGRKRVQEVTRGSRQSIETCHQENIALAQCCNSAVQLDSAGQRSANFLAVNFGSASRAELRDLSVQRLAIGGHPSVA